MAVGGLALRVKIVERKQEAQNPFFRVVALDDTTTDPALWGKNFPLQYDLYRRTVDHVRTRASAAARRCRVRPPRPVPARSFRDPQPGTCLHCRRSVYVTYKTVGAGDLIRGFEKVNAMSYPEARKLVEHPVACIDCHDPRTMALRITRPGFLEGIRTLKAAEGITDYDPNRMASRQEMRAFVWALNLARNQHFYAFSHVLPLRVYRQHAPAMVACGTAFRRGRTPPECGGGERHRKGSPAPVPGSSCVSARYDANPVDDHRLEDGVLIEVWRPWAGGRGYKAIYQNRGSRKPWGGVPSPRG